jgi:hypothetical protein
LNTNSGCFTGDDGMNGTGKSFRHLRLSGMWIVTAVCCAAPCWGDQTLPKAEGTPDQPAVTQVVADYGRIALRLAEEEEAKPEAWPLVDQRDCVSVRAIATLPKGQEVVNLEVERRTVDENEDRVTEWQPVDYEALFTVLERSSGYEPDPVPDAFTDSVFTSPLPARLTGQWSRLANHPALAALDRGQTKRNVSLKLVRYLDFNVTAGTRYQYRVRLEMLETDRERIARRELTRFTDWSKPSETVFVREAVPGVYLLDGEHLGHVRQSLENGEETYAPAWKALEREADKALRMEPVSVIDKEILPPSGDKQDYISQGPYWWPDPDTPDGLPYIRRDGRRNPEIDKHTDRRNMGRVVSASETLALAWFLSGDEKYARKAAELLRTWYITPGMRMNPHLKYGQGIPGRTEGRGIGIIETRSLVRVVDAAGLLVSSSAWTDEDHEALQKWFGEYLDWLLTSRHGRDEARTKNNHATYYDVQVASFALFVGKEELARKVLREARQQRIATQIEPDGRQPHELTRTRSWGYSTMNLRGMLELARLGEHVGVDLWNFTTEDGRGIRAAVEWLVPFAAGEAEWTHEELRGVDPEPVSLIVRQARLRYRDEAFQKLTADVLPVSASHRARLTVPDEPVR